jgi:hypothetical protein
MRMFRLSGILARLLLSQRMVKLPGPVIAIELILSLENATASSIAALKVYCGFRIVCLPCLPS